jgi:hypothetical protein
MPLLGTVLRLARTRGAQRVIQQASVKAREVATDPRTRERIVRIRTRMAEEKAADEARRAAKQPPKPPTP